MIQRAKADGLPVDAKRVGQAIEALAQTDEITTSRRQLLLSALAG